MPNHYHFLLKQKEEDGIHEFMHRLDTSYTKYFNLNNHRSGHLFEYAFKAKEIGSDELLLHIARYIHLNPILAGLVALPEEWKWSSYKDYLLLETHPLSNTIELMTHFPDVNAFEQFTINQISYSLLLKKASDAKDEDILYL